MCCNMAKTTPTCHSCGKSRFGAKYFEGVLIRECKDCGALFDTIKQTPFVKLTTVTRANKLINTELARIIKNGCPLENLKLHISPHSPLASQSIMESAYGNLKLHVSHYIPKGIAYIINNPGQVPGGFAFVSSNVKKREMEAAAK